ncbi:MAG: TonB-dependent receptor [Gemmatimonadales bacterium]|nr:TonB-dependent receptor [Gemmatimonadales bacterium]
MRRSARTSTFVVALAALAAGRADAQQGTVAGVVQERGTGAPIVGASVVIRGTPLSSSTGAAGRFSIGGLQPGTYQVNVAAIGYATDSVPGIVVGPGDRREVVIALDKVALELQEIVVTAGRTAERSDESTVSDAALPLTAILQRNVRRLDEALLFVPGITRNSGDNLDIRGASGIARGVGSRVLMMIDGHPVLSANGGEINFSTLPSIDLERTEVVKGAYSATYGTNALGGVVNLITAPILEVPQTALRVSGGAYNFADGLAPTSDPRAYASLGMQHSRRFGDVGARLFLGYENSAGYTYNGGNELFAGRLKLQSSAGSAHPWDGYAIFTREHAEEFFVWGSPDDPFRPPVRNERDNQLQYNVLTGATITPIAGSRTLLKLSPYFNFNSNDNDFVDNQDWQRAYKPGLIAQVTWFASERHALTLGGDGAHTWTNSNFLGTPTVLEGALFAQDEAQLSDRLRGTAGLRLDYNAASTADPELALSPKLGVSYRLAPSVTMRASAGGGYRAPSVIERFVSTVQSGFQVVPNPALRGERAWSAEVGATATVVGRVRVDGAVYGSYYDNLIAPGPAPIQPGVFQFQNISRARVLGLDLGVSSYVVPRWLEAQLTYLFLDTEDLDTGRPLPYRSTHNLTATLNAVQGRVGLDLRYRSRVKEVIAYPLDERGDITVLDLRLQQRVAGVLLQFKVANLLNDFYVDVQERTPGAPRSVTVSALYGL